MKFLRYINLVFLLFSAVSPAFAQDTTSAVPIIAGDTVKPISNLAPLYQGPANGFSDGVWIWDRAALLNESAVTLSDLLERIPGLLPIRSGLYVQPEVVSVLGATANRVEVSLDGYILDPLLESTYDVAKLELANIETLRVERRLGLLRVHIETLTAKDTRSASLISAGVGQPNANLFRGVFLSPRLFFGPLSLGIDRVDTNGLDGREPADQAAGYVKYAYVHKGSGLQVEYRRLKTDRNPEFPAVSRSERADVIVRARARIRDGLVAEVFGGRSTVTLDTTTVEYADSVRPSKQELKNIQIGARVSFESPLLWVRASFHNRSAQQLPGSQIDGAAGLRYNLISATAEFSQDSWRHAGSAAVLSLRAEAGPLRGVRVFAEKTNADRGVPFRTPEIVTNYSGYRAGAVAEWKGMTAGAALLHAKTDSVLDFGVPPLDNERIGAGGAVSGVELSGRLPIPFVKGLYATGNLTEWSSGRFWLYQPTRLYRAGAELHTIPLPSGNLEVLGRIEALHRGSMFGAQTAQSPVGEPVSEILPAVNVIDAYLMIRIMDVRAFLRYEDLTGRDPAEYTAQRVLRGPRVFYGVTWSFWN